MKTPKTSTPSAAEPERVAKVIARAGVSSRREAEAMIAEGRVALNGVVLDTPAVTVKPGDVVTVDGQPLPERERTRLWMFHKPRGLVTTTHDPEGRRTVFDVLPDDLPRVMTVGRLDINTEGLLLLTNDGGLSRVLELPATGWLRRYRVRAHGAVEQAELDALRDGVAIDGILYGAVEATLDSRKGDNVWLTVGLREGKNREVKNILAHLGLDVNRLIRLSFGPFQLGDLPEGAVEEVPRRVLKEQLGERLAGEAGADFRLREGERQPERQRDLGIAEPAAPRDDDERPPEAKGKVARAPRRPDAARSRHRHEADIAHNADARQGRGADARQGRGGERAPGRDKPHGRPAPRPLEAGAPKRRAAEERREPAPPPNAGRSRLGAAKPEALTPDRPKRLDRPKREAEAADAPRAHRTGRAFEVARKPKPEPAERSEAPRGALKSRGSLSHGGGPDAPSRARGSRSHGAAAERDGGRAAPRPVADERPRGRRGEPDTGGFRPRTDAMGGDEFERREARTGGPAARRSGRDGGDDRRPRRPGGEENHRFRRAGGDEPRAGGRSDKAPRAAAAAGEERRARAPRPSAVEGGPKGTAPRGAGQKTTGRGEARGPRAPESRDDRPRGDRAGPERARADRPRTERPRVDGPASGGGKPRAGKPGGGKPAAGGPKPGGPGGRPGGGKPRGPHADRRR